MRLSTQPQIINTGEEISEAGHPMEGLQRQMHDGMPTRGVQITQQTMQIIWVPRTQRRKNQA